MAASSAALSPRKPSSMRRLPSTTIDGRLKSFNCGYRATRSFISGMSWLSPAPWTTIARSPGGGARIIPNPVNRVAGFAIRDHHFFPGFPQMAWPMLDWVLATYYAEVVPPVEAERTIVVYGAGESQLLPLMNECVARHPQVKLFSLPSFLPDGGRRIELGVRGEPSALPAALALLIEGVEAGGFRWEHFAGADGEALR